VNGGDHLHPDLKQVASVTLAPRGTGAAG